MRKLGTSLSVGLGALLLAGNAFAQAECNTSDDCGSGMVCEVVGSSGCAGAPDCAEGADCEPAPECEPEVSMGCVPAPCETDADCGADMVCHTETWESCSGSASESCDDQGNCETIETPAECEEGSTSQCIYRWQAGCEADADCGEGFTCESYEVGCDCAVSVDDEPAIERPAESAEDGSNEAEQAQPPEGEPEDPIDEAPAPECECAEPQKVNYCEPKQVECDTAADCPDGWTCESQGGSTCGGEADVDEAEPAEGGEGFAPPSEQGGSDGAEGDSEVPPADDTAEEPLEDPCQPVEGPKMCVPPGGGYGQDQDVGSGAPTGTDAPREETADDPKGDVDEGAGGEEGEDAEPVLDGDGQPEDEDVAEPSDEDTMAEGETANEETDADDSTAEGEEGDDAKGESEGDDAKGEEASEDGGCSVHAGSARGSSPLWLSALLGLALLRRRKHSFFDRF